MASEAAILKKKKHGIYYTPLHATQFLCDWAIRTSNDLILEPSFGGCSFLQSSRERLIALGSKSPNAQLYGADIDKEAFRHLSKKIGPVNVQRRFLLSDFLSVRPDDFDAKHFDVVLGNPPYTAYRNVTKSQRKRAKACISLPEYPLRRTASLWAYFIFHSLQFIRPSGRMAWLLPKGLLQTLYGKDVVTCLEQKFARLMLLPLTQRLFVDEGTSENTVVLLAEGYGSGAATKGKEILYINRLDQLTVASKTTDGSAAKQRSNQDRYQAALTKDGYKVFSKLLAEKNMHTFGNLADIRIGVVTGNNQYFVLDQLTARRAQSSLSSFRLIFSGSEISRGLCVAKPHLENAKKKGVRCLLLSPLRKPKRQSTLHKYLAKYKKNERDSVLTFNKRERWYAPDDRKDPDAFFSYMCHLGPRLVVNTAKTTCVNSIHRIYFRKQLPVLKKKLIALSMATTLSNLCAEVEGRCYGQGVLKIEPSEAKRIRVYLPVKTSSAKINTAFREVNALLRRGDHDGAQKHADAIIFASYIKRNGLTDLHVLRRELSILRSRRIAEKKTVKQNVERTSKIAKAT